VVGAATTSTSTPITILTETRILAAVTATTLGEETAAETPTGDIIRNIAVAPRIGTELPRTDSAAQHGGTHWLIAKQGPGNRLADKAVIWPAIALAVEGWATELWVEASVTDLVLERTV
jgi:hypothetical protein